MGVVVVACAAAGSRTFALDSRASAPICATMVGAIQSASIPGEEVSSPGPPSSAVVTGGSSRRICRAGLLDSEVLVCRPPKRGWSRCP